MLPEPANRAESGDFLSLSGGIGSCWITADEPAPGDGWEMEKRGADP